LKDCSEFGNFVVTLINLIELYIALEKNQIKDIAKLLKYGFTSCFNMNYPVPRLPLDTKIK
jgi:hypothetical protein